MKMKREKLVRHLEKISCNGQVKEAIFTKGFALQAMTPDHLLLVVAPSLKGVEPLTDDIGVTDLPLFVKALGLMAGEGNEGVEVDVRVEKHRLVIDEGSRGVQRLMTAAPRTIATRVEPETVGKVKEKVNREDDGIALTRSLIDGIRNTFAAYKAVEVELLVGPEGGKVRVGSTKSHLAEFESEALTADEEYTLLFGEQFIDVLSVITDFSSAVMRLSGPEGIVAIEEGSYAYYLSPRARAAEEEAAPAKEPKKGKAKAAAAATAGAEEE
jgi:hypothetical protein